MADKTTKQASSKQYPDELKERAVRMVGKLRHADPNDQGVIARVARQLGVGKESLRAWVKQAAVDAGHQHEVTAEEYDELVTLRKENKELRRANAHPSGGSTADARSSRFHRRPPRP